MVVTSCQRASASKRQVIVSNTERFNQRAESCAKYRPHYPAALLTTVANEISLTSEHVIADIGSGTGISSQLFLENGNHVFGVEPNADNLI